MGGLTTTLPPFPPERSVEGDRAKKHNVEIRPRKRPLSDKDPNWGAMGSIGLQMLAGVVLGLFVGQWLDRKFGWTPWGTLAGCGLGVAAGMYSMIREGIAANRDVPPIPPTKKKNDDPPV